MSKKYKNTDEMLNGAAPEAAFLSWADGDEAGRISAVQESAKSIEEYCVIDRNPVQSKADTRFNDYSNLLPGISSRPGLTREGYNFFRPEESTPKDYKDIFLRCNGMYQSVGLIKNVIDLMGDFTAQGIRLSHPNKKIEKWFNNWFSKVRGPERSERFANYLYRVGNVIVRKQTAKINVKIEENLYKTHADADFDPSDIEETTVKTYKKEIPWKYTFLDPATVIVVGGGLASFVGKPAYAILLPDKLRRQIMSPKGESEKALVAQLPADIIAAAKSRKPYPLQPEKTAVYHYKKDDWDAWAYPIIFSIFKDAIAYDKMKLADVAALDGAISNIRIFTVGDVKNKILPTTAATAKLAQILQSHTGAGTMDIVWGEDLKLTESNSNVWQFLGEEKYKPILNALYAGLGIPPTLTGTYGAAGTTNNFISLKTLTERLEYGRSILTEFWEKEIALVQKAMGFRFPAKIEYDLMNLGDETATYNIFKEMVDRNIISDETMQKILKQDPEMESTRVNREAKARDNGQKVNKTGPYYEQQASESLKKIALQQGVVTPSQVGVDLPPPKEGEVTMMDKKHEQDMAKQELANKQKIAQQKMKGKPGQGRPSGKKDSTKRKTKTFKPRSKAAIEIWAKRAQAKIAEILNPGLLQIYGKSNMRMLSDDEAAEAERVKFGVLCSIEPFTEITQEVVANNLNVSDNFKIINKINKRCLASIDNPTLDELKHVQAYSYAEYYGDN